MLLTLCVQSIWHWILCGQHILKMGGKHISLPFSRPSLSFTLPSLQNSRLPSHKTQMTKCWNGNRCRWNDIIRRSTDGNIQTGTNQVNRNLYRSWCNSSNIVYCGYVGDLVSTFTITTTQRTEINIESTSNEAIKVSCVITFMFWFISLPAVRGFLRLDKF